MTAPRARERAGPPSPPERRPPRRGGSSSPSTYAASAAGPAGPACLVGARRGLVRSARALAATALLALTGALALPATAQAQTVTTLVSNNGQAAATAVSLSTQRRGQRFSTGSNPDGYSLSSVDFTTTTNGSFSVQVCGVSGVSPTSSCTGLTAPSGSAAGTKSFTVPAETVLAADTTYSLVTDAGTFGLEAEATTRNAEDAGHVSGFGIANAYEYEQSNATWTTSGTGKSFKVVIKGTVVGVPTVTATAVTSSPGADNSYETGEVIQVTVTFTEAVTVDTGNGTPSLELTIGSNPRDAEYSAADSTATALVFAYPVTTNDHDQNGISIDANALELNGGAIHKEGDTSTDALLTHGALSTQSGHRVNLAPQIVSGGVSVTSSPDANSSYVTGDVIQVTVTFDEAVTVDTTNGTPRLALTVGSNTRDAEYSAADSTATALVFAYPVAADDHDQNGISIDANALELNGGAIHQEGDTSTDALLNHDALSRQSGHRVNRRPFIVSGGVSVTSSPDANSSYATDDVIQVTVTFSEAVTVDTTNGTPSLALSIGSNTRYAAYSASDSTATALVFAYPVAADDNDQNGISIAQDALGLNGGAIHEQGDTTASAVLDHGALSTRSGHRVNRDAFIVSGGVSVISTPRAATETYGAGETIEIEVEFSEVVNATTDTDFVISVSGMRRAALLRGSGTDKLVFGYTVQAGDSDGDGIWIGDQDRTLVGNRGGAPQDGAITSVATGRAANLTHGGLGTQSGHKVDGSLTPPSTDPVWSATMTAGDTQAGHGYDRTDLDAPTIGALDDDNFDYESISYGVLAIDVATNVVRFVVAEAGLPTNEILTLELGGHALAFSDRHNDISSQSQWYWTVPAELDDPATEFPVGSTATVCLRTATQVCPAGRIVTPNNPPVFTSSAAFSADENATAAGTVEASDNDTEDDVTGYAITGGADQALFSIDSTSGALTFDMAPDFEDPQDAGADNSYEVTVQATSGTGTREKTATQTIAVTVINVDEGQSGTVTVGDTSPMVGDALTASAANEADPDGLPDPFAPAWQWYRTPAAGSETEISGATSAAYTVVEADLGATLTAKASWTDKGGFANTLASAPTSAVAAGDGARPKLSIAGAEGAEDEGVEFTVTLSETGAADVTATWTASFGSDDTADAADLTATTTDMVTVAAGATTTTFTVPVANDTTDEDDQTFTVTLSGVSSNALLGAATAKGTIEDDDDPPTLTVEDMTVNEGNQDPDDLVKRGFPLRVTMSEASEKRIRFKVRRAELATDTASHADLTNSNSYIEVGSIAPGATEDIFQMTMLHDDSLDEDDETFTVEIYRLENGTAGEKTQSTITIEDDDPEPSVTVAGGTATEGDAVAFVVTLSAVSGRDVEVDYASGTLTIDATSETDPQSAVSGTDFTAASGTLTIEEGETTGTIEVETTEAAAAENAETFTLTLSNPMNATLGMPSAATGTINDRALSTDATLSSLVVNDGTSNLTLDPAFVSTTTVYEVSVAGSVDEVTVTPVTNHASANFEIRDLDGDALADADAMAAGHQVAVAVGATYFLVTVTILVTVAEDDTTTRNYNVEVTRPLETLTPPADALVSNIGQGTGYITSRKAIAQGFGTGSNASGYTLTGVDVASAGSTAFTAQVCGADTNGRPTSTCTNLMPLGTFAVGAVSFTAPPNTVLTQDTSYAVVVTASGNAHGWGLADTNGEDAGKADGWSIRDDSAYRFHDEAPTSCQPPDDLSQWLP